MSLHRGVRPPQLGRRHHQISPHNAMIIRFRVHYRTIPGQSLQVCLRLLRDHQQEASPQVLPLHWLNHEQWQGELELPSGSNFQLSYHYQLIEESPPLCLDEWLPERSLTMAANSSELLLLIDTWRSAGTVDYAYHCKAMRKFLPARKPSGPANSAASATHTFSLFMTAVPEGLVPCLIGNQPQLGGWNWHHALPLREIDPNRWCCEVYLNPNLDTEYKYGLYDPMLGCAVKLETGHNRLLPKHSGHPNQCTRIHDEGFRRESSDLIRAAGVAIPVFSLRSESGLGVGEFADLALLGRWAARIGLKLIQILPINDTTAFGDWRDSYPYSAISTCALHPLYLRLSLLPYPMPDSYQEKLTESKTLLNLLEHVDYPAVMNAKLSLAREVFDHHHAAITTNPAFLNFLANNRSWLLPYAAFRLNQQRFGSADFSTWPDPWPNCPQDAIESMADPTHADWPEFSFYLWLQYELDQQLQAAVAELKQLGVALKGDLPIGIHRHSVEAWTQPHCFHLDRQTGAPPDAFAIKGQNWGFPTYHWEHLEAEGYAWWIQRFQRLSQYFDAYRIDHILGFFRIWSIPADQSDGIMGWFSPALPFSEEEFRQHGIEFDPERFCRPDITRGSLWERFGDATDLAVSNYLIEVDNDRFQLRDHVATQQQVLRHFESLPAADDDTKEIHAILRDALLECIADVLFLEESTPDGTRYHPRFGLEQTRAYQQLDAETKRKVSLLADDYFHRRHTRLWRASALRKLPALRRATDMLLCGEDLGMVPSCVPDVLAEMGILSLEIQRMPKVLGHEFADPAHAPHLSVVSPSTHDMSPIRSWWREDPRVTERFAWQALGNAFPPMDMTPEIALSVISQHLASPAMWAVFAMQDLLAVDATLHHPDPDAERINIPAVMPHYWRYRCHLSLEELNVADELNQSLATLIRRHRR